MQKLTFRLDEADAKKLRDLATLKGMTFSAYMRKVLEPVLASDRTFAGWVVEGEHLTVVYAWLRQHEKIRAIISLREAMGLGLKEAKDIVDDILAKNAHLMGV